MALTYRPEIDGLRAIAVTAVILFHIQLIAIPGGFVGVDIFFGAQRLSDFGPVAARGGGGHLQLARFLSASGAAQRVGRRYLPLSAMPPLAALPPVCR